MKKQAKKDAEPQPMDASAREDANPVAKPNHQRVCWALKTLVTEVLELFPETPVEYSNYDGRNTALDATFDLTVHDHDSADTLRRLLLLAEDERTAHVIVDEGQALFSMNSNPRTQDSREPFGLADALLVLSEPEGYFLGSDEGMVAGSFEDGSQ